MINLLPSEVKELRSYGRKNQSLFGYSIALLITAFATTGIMLVSLQVVGSDEPSLKKEVESTNASILTQEKDIKAIEETVARLEAAEKISSKSVSFSELIPKIGAVLPQGAVLNALSLTGGNTDPLQLDVNLSNAALAPVLIKNLVESDLFEAADIASLNLAGGSSEENEESTGYAYSVSITASFTGTAEARRKAEAAEAAKRAKEKEAAAAAAESGKKE
jgi:Tfp pilus assembly protein PilN